jgi:hypothetical protein
MDIKVITSMSAAEWIQAAGSVVAIGAAARIASRQTRETLAAAEADRIRKALVIEETLLALATQFAEELHNVETCYATKVGALNFTDRFMPQDLFVLVEAAARAIPMHEMPSPAAVTRLIGLLRCIQLTRNIYDTVLLRLQTDQPFEEVRAPLLSAVTMAALMRDNFKANTAQMRKTE